MAEPEFNLRSLTPESVFLIIFLHCLFEAFISISLKTINLEFHSITLYVQNTLELLWFISKKNKTEAKPFWKTRLLAMINYCVGRISASRKTQGIIVSTGGEMEE